MPQDVLLDDPLAPHSVRDGKVPVRVGDVLVGRYRVERVLGIGGMGVVVAALHLQTQEHVALKFMLPDAMKNPEMAERFVREARAAARLRNPHVAKVMDVGQLEAAPGSGGPAGAPYMVMEYLDGNDLREAVSNGRRLSVRDAVHYIMQACEGVAEAHALGIVHRDIKPHNLFLARTREGQTIVKVLDFGISKSLDNHLSGDNSSLTRTTAIMGSPHYMSPEQMRAARAVDCRADVWGLGICLYQFLTGRVPFEAESLMELGAKVLREAPPPPTALRPDLHGSLVAVVLKCLEKEPAKRYADAGELASALRTAIVQGSLNAPETWAAPPPDVAEVPTRIAPIPAEVRAAVGAAPAVAPAQPGSYGGRTDTAWGESHSDLKPRPRVSALVVGLGTFFAVLLVAMTVLLTVTRKPATNASPVPSSPSGTPSSEAAPGQPTSPPSAAPSPATPAETTTATSEGVPAPPATGVSASDGAPDAGARPVEGHHHHAHETPPSP